LFKQFILPGVTVKPAIGDFDGDNLIDFVIMNNSNIPGINELCVAFYELDTTSKKFALRQTIEINNEYREFAIADFDGDNLVEFFTGTGNGNVLGIKNIANDRYEIFLLDSLCTPNLYVSRYAGDLDNDGNKDIIMIGTTWGYSQIYWLNYSEKHLKVRRKIVLSGTDIFSNVHLSLSDVDNDHNEELILNLGFSLLILKWSEANREFKVLYYMQAIPSETIDCVEVYDIENDSTPDLFISVSRVQQPSFITYYYKNKFLPSSVFEPRNTNNFFLGQNHPNPVNPSTKITYSIAKIGIVTLKIYDILGREVSTLVNEEKPAGKYIVSFNASHLASGVYFYRLQAGDFVQTKKMILLQ
ncbi:MAG: T9SS type A sorting domain-containing protein, partial [Ignavibacteria bacterium]|nr:T9SS type A sorting domain-containing protein [Ignavibacteria bacterium]